jgi:hypothetical protein
MKLKLLPSESFIIQTQDSIELVRQKLMAQVRESTSIQEGSENYFFKGQVFENGFKIDRNVNYGNFYMPTVIGRLEDISEGTTIYVQMKVNYLIHLLTVFSLILSVFYLVYGLKELGVWISSGTIYSHILAIASEPLESPLFIMINFIPAIRSLTEYWKQFNIDREKLNQILVEEV